MSPAYLTKRFDVLPDGARLQQEDFAQIAEMSEDTNGRNYKYDFSYEKIAALLSRSFLDDQLKMRYASMVEKRTRAIEYSYGKTVN